MSDLVPLVRPATLADAEDSGRICFEAMTKVADQHGFPPDFPSADVAIMGVVGMINHPKFHCLVAEVDGRIIGSMFVDERSTIYGLGPLTVDPVVQARGAGTAMLRTVQDRCAQHGAQGQRFMQAAFNTGTLSMCAKLGYVVREPFAVLQGDPSGLPAPTGRTVRPATEADATDCNALCVRAHGHDRAGELGEAISNGLATVAERDGRIVGYTTSVAFYGHSVAEGNDDLVALIAATAAFGGPGILVPLRNAELLRRCLDGGLRMTYMMNQMSTGTYQEPRGAVLASSLY